MLKICMDKNFIDFFLTFLFSKNSDFPDFPWSFTKFPDFPERVETLPLLVEIPKVKNQNPWKFHEFFNHEHLGNSSSLLIYYP